VGSDVAPWNYWTDGFDMALLWKPLRNAEITGQRNTDN
jgi:hypothetical protein